MPGFEFPASQEAVWLCRNSGRSPELKHSKQDPGFYPEGVQQTILRLLVKTTILVHVSSVQVPCDLEAIDSSECFVVTFIP